MRLAIVIVSHNTCDLLRNCLHSVFAAADRSSLALDVDVVVVDNASHDGSVKMVAASFPSAVDCAQRNLGFANANNLALHLLGFSIDSQA